MDIETARTRLARAEGRAAAGLLDAARDDLDAARPTILRDGGPGDRARWWGVSGETLRRRGALDEAASAFTDAIRAAQDAGDPRLQAAAENGLGLVRGAQADDGAAMARFDAAARLARSAGRDDLGAIAQINAARLAQEAGSGAAADRRIAAAGAALAAAPATPVVAMALTALGDLERERRRDGAGPTLRRAVAMAEALGEPRALTYALIAEARLAEDRGRGREAEATIGRALVTAAALDAPDLDYLLLWAQGRLAARRGDRAAAIDAYAAAIDQLDRVREGFLVGFSGGRSPFRSAVEPLFRAYAAALVARAEASSGAARRADLDAVRTAIERLKAAELRDFFGDDCLQGLEARRRAIDTVSARTAALYPILLDDRLVTIAALPSGMQLVTVPVSRATVVAEVRRWRSLLEKRTTREHLRPGRRLHDWLIAPLEAQLRADGVETLVFTPDGALNTVPPAALHDGERYLVERYATATTSGLDLIDPRPIAGARLDPLLLGLTEARAGFAPLPAVADELAAVARTIGGEPLLNERFDAGVLERRLARREYSVVHIASHARFEPTLGDSFLLGHDGPISLDALERAIKFARFRADPVELLTLSACSTAAGDDRSALGLAGVAIKAGARSALASLWHVNDESTADLIAAFYSALREPGATRAGALAAAQRASLADRRTAHPGYWASFLMIGAWV